MDVAFLNNWFSYHSPTSDQLVSYAKLRGDALSFAKAINDLVPDGADKSAAIRLLRECVMTANAGIACASTAPVSGLTEIIKRGPTRDGKLF
jgi:hypothetical protein